MPEVKPIYDEKPPAEDSARYFWREAVKVILGAVLAVVVIRHFIFKPFYVEGPSMQPTFDQKQYLIIDELSYRFRDPPRGDVIVFRQESDGKVEYLLKRIIGLPGERIKISDNVVSIYNDEHPQGVVLKESYLPTGLITPGEKTVTLGAGQYFVMGDNRVNSRDSRHFGPIERWQLVGRVLLRGWPISEAHVFKPTQYEL